MNQWHYVAFVYDGDNKIGTFQVDNMFGYNEAGTDKPGQYFGFGKANWFRTEGIDSTLFVGRDFYDQNKFNGAISCLQIFNRALSQVELEAEQSCPIDPDRKIGLCPDGFDYIMGDCYQLSVANRKFSDAEVTCQSEPNNLYRKQLVFSRRNTILDFLSVWALDKAGFDSFWIGLDDRDEDISWETSDGSPAVDNSSPLWAPGQSDLQKCAVMRGNNGGYLKRSSCSESRPFLCSRKPLDHYPDNPCPRNYVPYQDHCLLPRRDLRPYEEAKVVCVAQALGVKLNSCLFKACLCRSWWLHHAHQRQRRVPVCNSLC